MKSIKSVLFVSIVMILINIGCKKNDLASLTSLEIRLVDEQGDYISGATVKLYESYDDMQNETNQFGTTQTSDTYGKVTFTNLAAVQYYWFAEKGCQNNFNGITTTTALDPYKTKVVTSTLSSTGTLELTNQSQDQYQIYINGYLLLTADAGSSYRYIYVPAGSYYIEAVQINGSTDKTYTDVINCGSTLKIIFP